ncbi:MAG TPA: GNAT family N-acetyltransferase [Acidimicrobiales bacterium]|nr:GNAT family N-acetyltransferase [Acidimicrobiales bacterium]
MDADGGPGDSGRLSSSEAIRPVEDDQWPMVGWLYQLFRHDLALVVHGLPYEDGRYAHRSLDAYPSPSHLGYVAWRNHPRTGRAAPVGFALCERRDPATWTVGAFWVSPLIRREGVGHRLALYALSRHAESWVITFQHENAPAGAFWRRVADDAFGVRRWSERRRPVPHRPDVPADHEIVALR